MRKPRVLALKKISVANIKALKKQYKAKRKGLTSGAGCSDFRRAPKMPKLLRGGKGI